jgi:aryl-alcohol dehydrogenase-like predicted oxidoreductase
MQVSSLCLGTMMFGAWGNHDHAESVRIIDRALDAGINFIDTADVYAQGETEEIVGEALAGAKRDRVILATKFFNPMDIDPNRRGGSRRWVLEAVDGSLRRLRTDWIDLYQMHRPDPSCDIDETLGALSELVRAGKVRAIGSSTFPAHQIVEAQWVARRRGRERFVCEQPPYSMLARAVEADVLPVCQAYELGVICWSPLGAGWLSGKYRQDGRPPHRFEPASDNPLVFDPELAVNQRKLDATEALAVLAEEAGLTLIQLALAFVLEHPAVCSAIIGPRTLDHLEGQLGAESATLGEEILDRIDEIVPPGLNINPADAGWCPPAINDASLRRRRRPSRSNAASVV